jgi:hypothetical protein
MTPKIVFIVPYRDREQQYHFFSRQMKYILEDKNPEEYAIYYIHQKDDRNFNRGALKNIGFILVKQKYPSDYQNITLVFNDVDTMPYTKDFLSYGTVSGTVKHFYGFEFALGGIVSITGKDFEKVNGFPNLWGWGFEDNLLQKRVLDSGLKIDRSQFYPFLDKNILQLNDGISRVVNRGEFDRYTKHTKEGISSISGIQHTENTETGFMDITYFSTGTAPDVSQTQIYDLRNGPAPFKAALIPSRRKSVNPRFGLAIM